MALASPSPTGMHPDPDSCWAAVQRRDRAFNGRFWFSVQSTGVYCLPSCAARPPLRKNVAFHPSPEAAEAAGFRPCKRCKPRDWEAELGLSKPVARACALFEAADADQPPSLSEVARKVGVTANTLSKRFVAELGLTPRDWLIASKRERFRKALRSGEKVSEALYGAGYGSPSRVYESSDKALGMTPATYAKGGAGAHIDYTMVDSDYGRVLVRRHEKGIAAVFLGDSDRTLESELQARLPGRRHRAQRRGAGRAGEGRAGAALWPQALGARCARRAPRHRRHRLPMEGVEGADRDSGRETRTYGEIAKSIGEPKAARAVGRACATNQAAGVIPCHRAIGSSGALTGYRWGVARKERLLAEERRRSST